MTREGLMPDEAFVMWLIQSSERARELASDLIPGGSPDAMLLELRKPEMIPLLMSRLDCEREAAVFEKLADHIQTRPQLHFVVQFAREHLRALRQHGQALCSVLGLPAGANAVDSLLDPGAMRKVLLAVVPHGAQDVPLRADALLDAVLRNAGAIELRGFADRHDWGMLLTSDDWLLHSAADALARIAEGRGWHSSEVTQVLAALLDDIEATGGSDDARAPGSRHFDALAIQYLEQRLLDASAQLREQALEYARRAAASAPQFKAVRVLPAWIQYQRRLVGDAVEYFLNEEIRLPLRALVAHAGPEIVPCEGVPDEQKGLQVELTSGIGGDAPSPPGLLGKLRRALSPEPPTDASDAQVADLEVRCYLKESGRPQPILKCDRLAVEEARHLETQVAQLRGAHIPSGSEAIGERLLRVRVPVADEARGMLVEAIRSLLPEFVRSLVLCGVHIPMVMQAPWSDDLTWAHRAPYSVPQSDRDIEFTHDAEAIVDQLRSQYEQANREVRVIAAAGETDAANGQQGHVS